MDMCGWRWSERPQTYCGALGVREPFAGNPHVQGVRSGFQLAFRFSKDFLATVWDLSQPVQDVDP